MFNSKHSIDGWNGYRAQPQSLALSKTPERAKDKVVSLRVEAFIIQEGSIQRAGPTKRDGLYTC